MEFSFLSRSENELRSTTTQKIQKKLFFWEICINLLREFFIFSDFMGGLHSSFYFLIGHNLFLTTKIPKIFLLVYGMVVLLTNKENSTKTKIEQQQRFDAVRDCPNYNQAAPLLPGTYYNGQILLFSKCRYRCCILLCNNRNIHSAEFIVICTRK